MSAGREPPGGAQTTTRRHRLRRRVRQGVLRLLAGRFGDGTRAALVLDAVLDAVAGVPFSEVRRT